MTSHTTRRTFVAGLSCAALAAAERPAGKKPAILLRSGWQTVNIGDIGHTPGALSLLDRYFPEAQITLWPNRLTPEVREMLLKGYPRLKIADGSLTREDKPDTPELSRTTGEQLWRRLERIERDPAMAEAKVKSIMAFVEGYQERMVRSVRTACRV